MTITDFVKRMAFYTPASYTFWSGLDRSMYNAEKAISNTMLLVTPREWITDWRPMCSNTVDIELWFGQLIEITSTTGGTQQHKPYSNMEVNQLLQEVANTTIETITTDKAIHVLTSKCEFFDSPDGQSVNRQIWLKCSISLRLWNIPTTFDNSIFTFDSQLITFDNG